MKYFIPRQKIQLILSVLALFYFIGLQLVWVYKIENTWVRIFGELLTIPFIVLIPILLYFSIMSWFKNAWKVDIINILTITILLSTLGLVLYWSV